MNNVAAWIRKSDKLGDKVIFGRNSCGPSVEVWVMGNCRAGAQVRLIHVCAAAYAGKPLCIDWLLKHNPSLLSSRHDQRQAMALALAGGSLASITHLEKLGCTWNRVGPPGLEPIFKANPAPLNVHAFWLPWANEWDLAGCYAITSDSQHSLTVLYDCGYEVNRSPWDPAWHPAIIACKIASRACWNLALHLSGPPPAKWLNTLAAARCGEGMLQDAISIGAKLHPLTHVVAAREGNVGALQYLFNNNLLGESALAPLCEAAVMGNSLPCLRFARQRECSQGRVTSQMNYDCVRDLPLRGGKKHKYLSWDAEDIACRVHWDFDMLRFLCEHMDHTWARNILPSVAKAVEAGLRRVLRSKTSKGRRLSSSSGSFEHVQMLDWKVVLYLATRLVVMKCNLPTRLELLEEMAGPRRERAKALAGVFYKAEKLAVGGRPNACQAMWGAMAKVPEELRERIAHDAHLVVRSWAQPPLAF